MNEREKLKHRLQELQLELKHHEKYIKYLPKEKSNYQTELERQIEEKRDEENIISIQLLEMQNRKLRHIRENLSMFGLENV